MHPVSLELLPTLWTHLSIKNNFFALGVKFKFLEAENIDEVL